MADTKISALTAATSLTSAQLAAEQSSGNVRVPTSLFGVWTKIGTLTTTSGSTQTQALSATYAELRCVLIGVGGANTTTLRVAITDDGTNYGTARTITGTITNTDTVSGHLIIMNTGVAATDKYTAPMTMSSAWTAMYVTPATETVENGVTHSIRFSWASGNFDAGSIEIYGRSS